MAFFNDSDIKNNSENNNDELEVNRKNREHYENLMEDSKTKLDSYYDKNNIFIRVLLYGLFVFIVIGVLYYILLYLSK